MPSGGKRLIISSRERAISPDVNRLQAFLDAQIAEGAYRLFDPRTTWDVGSGAGELASTVGTPLRGHVLDGFMVVAPLASTSLLVTPGMALLIDPDGQAGSSDPNPPSTDDSLGKLVFDPEGVPAAGVLTLTANPGPGVRVDVVEMRRVPSEVLETDNRDIFDPSTGTNAPVAVTKVAAGRATFRIRTGAGSPPVGAQGWMPLAVIGVPVGAVDFDDCVLYDVRPLVRDRGKVPNEEEELFADERREFFVDAASAPGEFRLHGSFDSKFLGYRAGGALTWVDGAGSAQLFMDMAAGGNQGSYAPAANSLGYVWLLFPSGFPRWVRYSTGAVAPFGGRVPVGLRGIPVVSTVAPASYFGLNAAAPIALPSFAGIGTGSVAATNARCMLAFAHDTTGAVAHFLVRDNHVHIGEDISVGATRPNIQITPAVDIPGEAGITDQYTLTPGTHFPLNAKAVLLQVQTTFTGVAGTESRLIPHITMRNPVNANWLANEEAESQQVVMPAAGSMTTVIVRWVSFPYDPVEFGAATIPVRVNWNASGAFARAVGTSSLFVRGWAL